MGLILDTSLLVRAERDGMAAGDAIRAWLALSGGLVLGLSAITLAAFAHGVPRAQTPAKSRRRMGFLEAIRATIPVHSVDEEIAIRAGLIEGDLKNKGLTIGIADSLIAATALLRGDGVATLNAKHFRVVPGLDVVEL